MKATNTLAQPQQQNVGFGTIINTPRMRGIIDKSLGDPARATRFVASLIAAVNGSEQLRSCDPGSIVSTALLGEAMGLSLPLGQFYLVPYGTACTLIPGYKGYLRMAMRSGEYAELDAIEIREGEYQGRDPRTGKLKLCFIEDDDIRETKPIIGYYAYFELKDGTFRSEYWSRKKVLEHADRYSAAFSLEKYNKLVAGELSPDEARKCTGPWYDTDGQQITMCKKTLMRKLLNSGYAPLSLEMQRVMDADAADVIIPADTVAPSDAVAEWVKETAPETPAPTPAHEIDIATGEVLDEQEHQKRGRTKKDSAADTPALPNEPAPAAASESYEDNFFGMG